MSANTAVGIVLGLILGVAGSHLFEGPGFMTKAARAKDSTPPTRSGTSQVNDGKPAVLRMGPGPGATVTVGCELGCHCLLLVECAHLGVELPDWANPVDLVAPGRVN